MRKSQSGFTLIELVVVIVILAILAAVALPKFANLQAQARIAKMNGALGAMKSASTISHALLLANNYPANYSANPTANAATGAVDINVEGVDVDYNNGYPTAATIAALAGIGPVNGGANGAALGDFFQVTVANGILTLAPDANHTSCTITYTESTAANTAPTFSNADLTIGNCD